MVANADDKTRECDTRRRAWLNNPCTSFLRKANTYTLPFLDRVYLFVYACNASVHEQVHSSYFHTSPTPTCPSEQRHPRLFLARGNIFSTSMPFPCKLALQAYRGMALNIHRARELA
jgi:hypothetical protein